MNKSDPYLMNRRGILKGSAAALGGALLSGEPMEAYPKGVNTNSSPSALRITDLRVATVVKPGPSPCPIIRIDTNQGVYGLGEVRDGASATYALMLKSRHSRRKPASGGSTLPQDQAIRRAGAAGGRRVRRGDGLVGHCRQGLQRARLRHAGRQGPRQDSRLRRHHGIRRIQRFMPSE